jgi:hypothetical protein
VNTYHWFSPFHSEQLAGAWKILWGKFPGFHEHLLSLSNQPIPRRAIIKQVILDL